MAKYKKRPDGRYEVKIQTGYTSDGKRQRVTVYAKSISELDEKVTELKYKHTHGIQISENKEAFGIYALKWLNLNKAVRSTNTVAMYRNIITVHLKPLHLLPLKDIKRSDIQTIINGLIAQPRTCEQIKITCNQIFSQAIDEDILTKNPCKNLELPKKKPAEKRALTSIEIKALKKANFTPMQKAFVYIIYYCGLRRGEALALKKNDIDFKKKVIIVDESVALIDGITEFKDPKSLAGNRKVDMPSALIPYLRDYVAALDSIFLFTMRNGQPMTKSSYDKFWSNIVQEINRAAGGTDTVKTVYGLTAHIFRHNYCTLLYYSGLSIKKAAELMGHNDIKMIMEVYAHLDDIKEHTKEKIDAIESIETLDFDENSDDQIDDQTLKKCALTTI